METTFFESFIHHVAGHITIRLLHLPYLWPPATQEAIGSHWTSGDVHACLILYTIKKQYNPTLNYRYYNTLKIPEAIRFYPGIKVIRKMIISFKGFLVGHLSQSLRHFRVFTMTLQQIDPSIYIITYIRIYVVGWCNRSFKLVTNFWEYNAFL